MPTDKPKTPLSPQRAYRRNMLKILDRLRTRVRRRELNAFEMNDNDLDELHIKVGEAISLDPDAIDFGLRFCKPFPASRLEELNKTRWDEDEEELRELEVFPHPCRLANGSNLSGYFERLLGNRRCEWEFAASTPWQKIGDGNRHMFKLATGYMSPTDPGWAMEQIHRIADGSLPHTGCSLFDYSDTIPGDYLRYHEILCAVSLMVQAIKIDRKREFKVAPVIIYSFSSRRMRLLETHFDGEAFVIRKTEWLYFPHGEDVFEKVKLVLQWMMCTPIGSTRFSALPIEGTEERTCRQKDGITITVR